MERISVEEVARCARLRQQIRCVLEEIAGDTGVVMVLEPAEEHTTECRIIEPETADEWTFAGPHSALAFARGIGTGLDIAYQNLTEYHRR